MQNTTDRDLAPDAEAPQSPQVLSFLEPPDLFSSENNCSDKEELSLSPDGISSKHMALRASTAPARPLNDIEEFRRSSDFLLLEHTVCCASQLLQKPDGKYDLDSEEGQRACKKLLNQVERLLEVFKVSACPREYRNEFSKAYHVLYREGSLCYLNEILDSAQEAFPYLYVNGEKHEFSGAVLTAGSRLFSAFCDLQYILREIYDRVCQETCPESVNSIVSEISAALVEFDGPWVCFEQLYIHELMRIETEARRDVTRAIEVDKQLTRIELRQKAKGKIVIDNAQYNRMRGEVVGLLGKINSVANIEGKGRDDLKIDVLVAAEGLLRRMSSVQAQAVRDLCENIKLSFNSFRTLLRKYDSNIEIVDPQLKNNPELVEVLSNFEHFWERGKTFLLNTRRCSQLSFFSSMVDSLAAKFPSFSEQLECKDSELFVSIPGLLILRCLENCDKEICRHFYPLMFDEAEKAYLLWKKLKRAYRLGKLVCINLQEYIDLLEMGILGISVPGNYRAQVIDGRFDNIDYTLNKIKTLASSLHRHRPGDWNKFLDVALC